MGFESWSLHFSPRFDSALLMNMEHAVDVSPYAGCTLEDHSIQSYNSEHGIQSSLLFHALP